MPRNIVKVEVRDHHGNLKRRLTTHNLRTDAGTDWVKEQLSGTVSGSATFIGVSADAALADAADTTLAAEETTNGLIRAAGTVTMGAAGSTSYTVSFGMTYMGGSPISLTKSGLFSALTGGTLIFEADYVPPVILDTGDDIGTIWDITV